MSSQEPCSRDDDEAAAFSRPWIGGGGSFFPKNDDDNAPNLDTTAEETRSEEEEDDFHVVVPSLWHPSPSLEGEQTQWPETTTTLHPAVDHDPALEHSFLGHNDDDDDSEDDDEPFWYGDSEDESLIESDDSLLEDDEHLPTTGVIAVGILDSNRSSRVTPTRTVSFSDDDQEQQEQDDSVVADVANQAVSRAVASHLAEEEFDLKEAEKQEAAVAAVAANIVRRASSSQFTKSPSKLPPTSEGVPPAAALRAASDGSASKTSATSDPKNVAAMASPQEQQEQDQTVDLEAQAGIPVAVPGAFAMEGLAMGQTSNGRQVSGYDSGFDDSDHSSTASGNGETTPAPLTPLELEHPLPSEVRQERDPGLLVDSVPLFDDDDPSQEHQVYKYTRRVRLGFALLGAALVAVIVAVAVVVTSGNSSSSGSTNNNPSSPQGWRRLGPALVGPSENDNVLFGHSVSLSKDGNVLAVGLPGWDQGTGIGRNISVGRAHLYVFNETEAAFLPWGSIAGPGSGAEAGRAVSLSENGQRVAVASPKWQGGQVRVYQAPASSSVSTWKPVGGPLTLQETQGDFGFAVALSDDGRTLVAGAPLYNGTAGLVRIFTETNATWTPLGQDLVGNPGDLMGWSVAVTDDGRRVAVGSITLDRPGQVKVYDYIENSWKQLGQTLEGSVPQDRFGHSISLSRDGRVLAVAASGGITSGQFVQTFQYPPDSESWAPLGNVLSTTDPTENFGFSVSLSASGTDLAVGIPGSDASQKDSGQVRVYRFDKGNWDVPQDALQGQEGDSFGHAVSLSADGRRVAAGSPTSDFDGRTNNVGKTAVYEVTEE